MSQEIAKEMIQRLWESMVGLYGEVDVALKDGKISVMESVALGMKGLPFILEIIQVVVVLDRQTQREMVELMKTAKITWET